MDKKSILISYPSIVKLIKESIGKTILLPKQSFNNIFTLSEEVRDNKLMEGCFETYPVDKILKFLQQRYKDAAHVQLVYDDNHVKQIFMIKTGDIDYNQKIIDKDLALCGYFPSFVNKENGARIIQYEPLHDPINQKPINKVVYNEKYIYHLTQTNKIKKIFSIGLTPKSCNKKFVYPNRIYFFLHKPSKENCLSLMQQFYTEQLISKKTPYLGTYTLLKIDVQKIGNVNFSYDPNGEQCVFTYENIPPSAISIVSEIEQNYK